MNRGKLIYVQYLRALAATIVLLAHVSYELAETFPGAIPFLDFDGVYGVRIFFVISGFVIYYSIRPYLGVMARIGPFMKDRVIRIVPLYWFYTSLWIASTVLFVDQVSHSNISVVRIVTSLLFIPYPRPWDNSMAPLLSLGWSLNYEMFFYALLCFVLPFRRPVALPALATFLVTFVLLGDAFPTQSPGHFFGRPIVLLFVLGILLAELYARYGSRHLARPNLVFVVVVALMLEIHLGLRASNTTQARLLDLYLLPAAIVAAGVFISSPVRMGWLARAVRLLGDSSYSLYLVHPFTINALLLACRKLHLMPLIGPWVLFGLLVGGSIVSGILSYWLIEIPLLRLLRRSKSSTGSRTADTARAEHVGAGS